MKASELIKKYVSREGIDEQIKSENENGRCAIYVSRDIPLKLGVIESLINDGFKVSVVHFADSYNSAYKIEW